MLRLSLVLVGLMVPASQALAQSQSGDYTIPRGWYLESNLGAFFRIGGVKSCEFDCDTGSPVDAVGTSAVQPFVGFTVGKDLTESLGAQLLVGTGFVAGGAPGTEEEWWISNSTEGQNLLAPQDYSLTFFNFQGTYLTVIESLRVGLELKAGGGLVIASNGLVALGTEAMASDLPTTSSHTNVSGGASLKYLTLLTGFVVGVDVSGGYITVKDRAGIPYVSISPALKYVF
jgi:hypothetical protein